MQLAFLIDPLSTLHPKKDTSVFLMEKAQKLGIDCCIFTQDTLVARDNSISAAIHRIHIGNIQQSDWASTSALGIQNLQMFDCILMRQDPPMNREYLYATYALEIAEQHGVSVLNHPQGVRDTNEKFITATLPQCCPPTVITRDLATLLLFWDTHRSIILKPLDGMGGTGIFHIDEGGRNLHVAIEMLSQHGRHSILAQAYLPEIHGAGDKRIMVLNGDPLPFALRRMPLAGEHRANLAAGGRGDITPLTERDRWLCAEIKPLLQARGLSFVGVDVIGDYITEVNVTSPTCLREICEQSGTDYASPYLESLL
ncbi:MAG: glutathione synthase [Legionellaceae bacterium]|nr:glutathione synthase [Legionellaceae bacterium]